MDKTKQTLVIALVAVLVVVAGGWYFLISPQRSSVASLNAQAATVDSSNASLKTQILKLKAEAADLPGEQLALAGIAKRLPPDLQAANLLSDLSRAADAANVDLSAITPSAPLLVASTVAAPAPVASAAGKSAGTTAVTPKAAPANQLYQIPVSLTVSGNYFDLEMFVHSLEGMQRAMLIGQLSFTKATTAVAGAGSTLPSVNLRNGATSAPTAGTGSTGGTSTTSGTTGKGSTTTKSKSTGKPVPGSAAAAQAELDRLHPVLADSDTISLVITGNVFSMYSPAGVAAAAARAAAASASPAPTK